MSSNDRPVASGYSEYIPSTKGARNVDRKIIQFPHSAGEDKTRELVHTIPQASPVAPKTLY
jgi:hypothetical protein